MTSRLSCQYTHLYVRVQNQLRSLRAKLLFPRAPPVCTVRRSPIRFDGLQHSNAGRMGTSSRERCSVFALRGLPLSVAAMLEAQDSEVPQRKQEAQRVDSTRAVRTLDISAESSAQHRGAFGIPPTPSCFVSE